MATTTAVPYTFTEKKRIRKSFAKRASVLEVPFLLETQLASYRAFLQEFTPGDQRKNEGLQAAFTSIFPISSHSGNARLEFVSFSLLAPAFDVVECQQRGLTYCSLCERTCTIALARACSSRGGTSSPIPVA